MRAVRGAPSRAPSTGGRSMAADVSLMARKLHEANEGRAWPAERWQSDPHGFANTILGVRLWSAQVEMVEAIRDHNAVAIAGGRKIGKDFALAVAALWWFASFPGARVFMTATSAKQIGGILYREVRMLYAQSGRCVACKELDPRAPPPCPHSAMLTGKLGELAFTGLVAPDMREVRGYTAKDAEGLAGFSGARILALVDEASGYPDHLHTAIVGNLAAQGCKEVLISNPTRGSGFFFDAFHAKAGGYKTIQVSSLTTPNVVEGREVFPGLASRDWVERRKAVWGEDSPLFAVHVKGEFVKAEEGAIFSVHAIAEASARWETTPAEGPIVMGIDPAGEGGKGDESAFALRRGKKIVSLFARRGLTPEGHLVHALGQLSEAGGATAGKPRIVIDREGETGAKVWGAFVAHCEANPNAFELAGVRSSERAHRKPLVYDRVRDELSAVLADWFRDGGAIPDDIKLHRDLNAFRWEGHVSGRTKAMSKDKMRLVLGRSPDRADAIALSCWMSTVYGATAEHQEAAAPVASLDPYAQMADAGDVGGIDPYGRM